MGAFESRLYISRLMHLYITVFKDLYNLIYTSLWRTLLNSLTNKRVINRRKSPIKDNARPLRRYLGLGKLVVSMP